MPSLPHPSMRMRASRRIVAAPAFAAALLAASPAAAWSAQFNADTGTGDGGNVTSLLQLALFLGGLSLLPFAVMTLTSFLRIVVVLSFLRSGLGAQNVPPNIVVIALALFLSLFVMGPVLDDINNNAVQPMMSKTDPISSEEAFARAKGPLKGFMVKQISGDTSKAEVETFYELALRQKYGEEEADHVTCRDDQFSQMKVDRGVARNSEPDIVYEPAGGCIASKEQIEDKGLSALPLRVLIPSFIISELKKAFIMGFAVLLPFLVIDMVISNILLSLGMFMLPPVVISLPFKILLFVLAGGWTMVVKFIVMGFNY